MEIEKNVPMPSIRHLSIDHTPHKEMEIGDSIYLTGMGAKRQYCTIRMYGWRNGKKFSVRSDANGMRVWRIE